VILAVVTRKMSHKVKPISLLHLLYQMTLLSSVLSISSLLGVLQNTHHALALNIPNPGNISFPSLEDLIYNNLGNTRPIPEEDDDFDLSEHPEELETQILAMNKYLTEQMAHAQNNSFQRPPGLGNETGKFPDLSAFKQIFNPTSLANQHFQRSAMCSGCQVFVGLVMTRARSNGDNMEELSRMTSFTCSFFGLADDEVCEGVVERMAPTFYYITKTRPRLKSPLFCGMVLQSLGCSGKSLSQDDEYEWTVGNIDGNMRDPKISSVVEYKSQKSVFKEKPVPLKVLHLADLHIDPLYKAGSTAECDNHILCCQEQYGYPDPNKPLPAGARNPGAGQFGDNRTCDAPMEMLELALSHVQKTHPDIDVVYMTGDLVPHNIWYTNQEENSEIIRDVSAVIRNYFPDTRVIPCLGNHESHPVNFYSPTMRNTTEVKRLDIHRDSEIIPEDLRTDWVYDVAYESWGSDENGAGWIPTEEKTRFLKSGHYAIRISDRFRVFVINTNVCYGFNLWQLHTPKDPGGQLKWLARELFKSQLRNETVHLLGHVPPGHEDCSKVWSREFYKLITKYKDVVKAQFYGHTHFDEFRLYHDPENLKEAHSVQFVGPSLTPYRIHNPSYRVYSVDDTTGYVVDHETWIYDLHKENEEYLRLLEKDEDLAAKYKPNWYMLYRATEAYGLPDVTPTSLRLFVDNMTKDDSLFQLFYQHYFKASTEEDREPCDVVCRKRVLCGIVRSYYGEKRSAECEDVQKSIDGIVLPMKVLQRSRKRVIWL